MEPYEKALELIKKFYPFSSCNEDGDSSKDAKRCALICVDKIINELDQLRKPEYTIFITDYKNHKTMDGYEKTEFWQSVKEHILSY